VRATLGLEYVTHHLYAEQVRAALFARPGSDAQLAEASGRALSLDEAVAAARQALSAQGRRPYHPASTPLSAREREVLACIVEGMHDREIADQLCISPRTVQSHVLAILNKLGAHSRAEAVAIAIRNDLI
jgi:DNA-binding NarL/FixJ family response regulator